MSKKIASLFIFVSLISLISCNSNSQSVRNEEIVSNTIQTSNIEESKEDIYTISGSDYKNTLKHEEDKRKDSIQADDYQLSGHFGDNLEWLIRDGTLYVNGDGSMGDYSPPPHFNSEKPNAIAPPFYSEYLQITNLIVSDGVLDTGRNTFMDFSNLQSIELSNTIQMIGDGSFAGCIKLKTVDIPEGVKEIGKSAFENCQSLKEITIPESVQIIEDSAFIGCNDLSIIGKANSLAERYAAENGFTFITG